MLLDVVGSCWGVLSIGCHYMLLDAVGIQEVMSKGCTFTSIYSGCCGLLLEVVEVVGYWNLLDSVASPWLLLDVGYCSMSLDVLQCSMLLDVVR